jgi:hypothetical protein
VGQQQPHIGVVQHELEAVGRVVGVQRHVARARFEDGQNGRYHFQRAGNHEADLVVGLYAVGVQEVGQLVGPGFQFGVGQLLAAKEHGDGVGCGVGLLLKAVVDQFGGVDGYGRIVPGVELGLFLRGEQRRVADGLVRVGDHGGHNLLEVLRHAGDGGRVEEVGVVLEGGEEFCGRFLHVQQQIELGRVGAFHDGVQLDRQVGGHLAGLRLVVQHKHHLEQRVAAGITIGSSACTRFSKGYSW